MPDTLFRAVLESSGRCRCLYSPKRSQRAEMRRRLTGRTLLTGGSSLTSQPPSGAGRISRTRRRLTAQLRWIWAKPKGSKTSMSSLSWRTSVRGCACRVRTQPAYLTGCLLRTANRGVPPCLSQIVLLDVAQLRRRRPIHDKPSGYLRFAALVTKPGEISGLWSRRLRPREGRSPAGQREHAARPAGAAGCGLREQP